jgi:unsaturated chondroitin disaccharide hydrolase
MKILMAISEKFCNWDDDEDSVLQMGTEAYSHGLHMPIIYGDFFLVEAILKLKGNDFLIW